MLNRMSVRAKLNFGFGVLLAILVVLGIGSYRTIMSLDQAADEVGRKADERALALVISEATMKQSSGTRAFLLTGEEASLARDEEGKREVHEGMEKLNPLARSGEGRQLYGDIQRTFDAFRAVADKEIGFKRAGKLQEALEVMKTQAGPAFDALDKATDAFVAHVSQGEQEVRKAQDSDVAQGKLLISVLCLVGIAAGVLVSTLISRALTSGVSRMVEMIQELAANNLAMEIWRSHRGRNW